MTRFESANASPGFLLWRTTLAWQRTITAVLRPHALTHAQFVVLASVMWLSRHEAPNQQQLAAHAGTEPKMTSELARKLEAKGLIRRSLDSQDARARRLELTEKGRHITQEALRSVEEADLDFFGDTTSDAVRVLQKLMNR